MQPIQNFKNDENMYLGECGASVDEILSKVENKLQIKISSVDADMQNLYQEDTCMLTESRAKDQKAA